VLPSILDCLEIYSVFIALSINVFPMPTPNDSTVALSLERERSTHTTCPPDDDRSGQWRVEVLDQLGRTAIDSPFEHDTSRQQERLDSEARNLGPLDASIETADDKVSEHGPMMDSAGLSPPVSGASPSSSHVDEKEVEHIQPPAPSSSALDLQFSIRYGIDSKRVCQMKLSQ
jgi:hypothetical protein